MTVRKNASHRKKKGVWGIFGGKPKVFYGSKKELAEERLERMRDAKEQRHKEEQEKKKLAELERKRQRIGAEASLYEAKAKKKKAQRASGFQWPILPTKKKVKVRKKKQGRKLSKKRRIGLI